jgi:hypothetical protein
VQQWLESSLSVPQGLTTPDAVTGFFKGKGFMSDPLLRLNAVAVAKVAYITRLEITLGKIVSDFFRRGQKIDLDRICKEHGMEYFFFYPEKIITPKKHYYGDARWKFR